MDRSWYNRAGVERVMGFCSESQYREFLRECPEFERMLVRAGTIVVKYWFEISEAEQEARFLARINTPHKRWKLSAIDLEARMRWNDYSRARDEIFAHCDIKEAPWHVVNADIKKPARLNCIRHLLDLIPYEDLPPEPVNLPERLPGEDDQCPPLKGRNVIPEHYTWRA